MSDFAKIFRDEDGTQILTMLDQNDDGAPSVQFHFDPGVEGLGVCVVSIGAEDNDKGWEQTEKIFSLVDEGKARAAISEAKGNIVSSFV